MAALSCLPLSERVGLRLRLAVRCAQVERLVAAEGVQLPEDMAAVAAAEGLPEKILHRFLMFQVSEGHKAHQAVLRWSAGGSVGADAFFLLLLRLNMPCTPAIVASVPFS